MRTPVGTAALNQKSNHPFKTAGGGGAVTLVLWEHLPQVFDPFGRERDGLLVVGVIDPKAAVLRLHVRNQLPQQLLVLAKDFCGAADRDRVSWCCHSQAARSSRMAREPGPLTFHPIDQIIHQRRNVRRASPCAPRSTIAS